MRIFLSYASVNRAVAEEISVALKGDGHTVFFDSTSLRAGDNYHRDIRQALAGADLMVFLVSPDSVRNGAYTRTELELAEQRWKHPRGRIVPIVVAPTPIESVPTFLKAGADMDTPVGNIAAETAARVDVIARERRARSLRWCAAGAAFVALAAAGIGLWRKSAPYTPAIEESEFLTQFVREQESIERSDYALDPAWSLDPGRGDPVRLERLTFGHARDERAIELVVVLENTADEPEQLDLSPRYFALVDDRNRAAELLFFCCADRGELLGPGQERRIKLIYRGLPEWEGKNTAAERIDFRITGLLPLVRGTWSFRPLRTKARRRAQGSRIELRGSPLARRRSVRGSSPVRQRAS